MNQETIIPSQELLTIKTSIGGYPEAEAILTSLGCIIQKFSDHQLLTFPPGTKREEVMPRIRFERFAITLPGQITLYEYPSMANPSLSNITIPSSLIPDQTTLPTFRQTRIKHGVHLGDLIQKSRLRGEVIRSIDSKGEGRREDIDLLLGVLSDLTGEQLSRWNVGGFTFI